MWCGPARVRHLFRFGPVRTYPSVLSIRIAGGLGVAVPLRVTRQPQVYTLRELRPDMHYVVNFLEADELKLPAAERPARNRIEFHTFGDTTRRSGDAPERALELLVMSCNRYNEDRDDTFLRQLYARVFTPATDSGSSSDRIALDGTFMLGDQIYGDALLKQFGEWGLACVLQSFQVRHHFTTRQFDCADRRVCRVCVCVCVFMHQQNR